MDRSRRELTAPGRTPLRFLDAPGRALSRLTGADKASLNPLKKRISFTWYVNLL
jgi:hypothetical protein